MQGPEKEFLGEFKSRVASLGQWSCLDHPITQTFNLLTIKAGQGGPGPSVEGSEGCVCLSEGDPPSHQSWRRREDVSVSKSTLVLAPLRAGGEGSPHHLYG